MSDRGHSFFRRWSTRKQRRERDEVEDGSESSELVGDQAAGLEFGPEEEEMLSPDDLPDPETLGREADWSVFMKKNVPVELRRRALQRLWRVDPVYANLDGLVDYADDYNDPVLLSRKVKTLFQVGRGMVLPEEEPQTEPEMATQEKTELAARKSGAQPEEQADAPTMESEEVMDQRVQSGKEGDDVPQDETSPLRNCNITPDAKESEGQKGKPKDFAVKRRWDLG